MKMTTEEAFVKVLQMHGIEHAFGIIGSAMMPISDLFPQAGITFWDAAHECNAGMMADGFTRSTGKMSMMVAQNGPGITNFVTPVKTAYWNHTPLLLVTPQAANKTIGQGGFQEVEQMALFKDMVAYQEEVRDPARIAETLNRVILQAKRASAPAQINVPRDFWTQVIDIELPAIVEFERPTGGEDAIEDAIEDDEPAVERADPLCERVGRRLALGQDDLLDAPPLQALELRLRQVLGLLRREGVGDVNVGKLVDEALSARAMERYMRALLRGYAELHGGVVEPPTPAPAGWATARFDCAIERGASTDAGVERRADVMDCAFADPGTAEGGARAASFAKLVERLGTAADT